MVSEVLEIVELPNGDVALRRSGEPDALVTIRFAEQIGEMLSDAKLIITRAMFQAGVDAFTEMAERQNTAAEGEEPVAAPKAPRILH